MITLFQNSLYRFSLLNEKQQVLFFDWTAKTKEMSYEDFQAACHNFAGFAWQYQSTHLLVDTCNFHLQLPAEFPVWREEQLNPRYYKLGVLKFAYITKPEFIGWMKDIPAENGKFETKNFTSVADAVNWLNH
ncbi:MAG: hypothetical protein EAY81_08295 [Bacteroidetes bacterium]|nr:MAG: hypothetical protein EAY81_08295 [Bacteroidota bacterium]